MKKLKVGHVSNLEDKTGVSVFLFEEPARGAYQLCGAGPATRELTALELESSTPCVHALVLSGGSAFGLQAAHGVMQFLSERGVGLALPHGVVPIVPGAAIYDLNYQGAVPPTPKDGYAACLSAKENNTRSGRIGAGTGATVGKLLPAATPMTGGLGHAQLSLPNGVMVEAYVVVNAVGDVRGEGGEIIAGARMRDGQFGNIERHIMGGEGGVNFYNLTNTTLAAVFTNAAFSKPELKQIAKMAVAGMARAIAPVFTSFDGDIVFAFSLGDESASIVTIGTMAAEALRLAIVNAVADTVVIH